MSLISNDDVLAPMRMPSSPGALLTCGSVAVPRVRTQEFAMTGATVPVLASARPQSSTFFGNGAQAAGQVEFARQQRISPKYAHTTRIAPIGGGAMGPHPARDPV
ncbi:MAG TPA: hypothetical protein VNF47_02330 [Streptosporangiaceae bacterium]|nr:hypothetical protein [Streptosporangiaceae bacterium]